MLRNILVINCGSSSVKFSVFDQTGVELASGLAERLDSPDSTLTLREQGEKFNYALGHAEHKRAIHAIVEKLEALSLLGDGLAAVGHRVVHGGEYFASSVVVDEKTLANIASCSHLAPLHNPANILGITLLRDMYPELPQVAVFDTAFHQSLPPCAYTYGLPHHLYQEFGLRRYGFHGTSHRYVSEEAARRLGRPYDQMATITAHLGNGCSAAAVLNGKSVDTTMGLTPLEGLVMGTRSGDIDPSIHQFIADKMAWPLAKVTELLNKQSGLLGISELSNDMRTLCESASKGHEKAQLAIEVFCYRLAKAIASLAVPLGRIDALVFTGGIGENAAEIRANTLAQLGILGFSVDAHKNARCVGGEQGQITKDNATLAMVIATNEEWMIAKDTLALIQD